MRGTEGVVFALAALGEPGKAAALTHRTHAPASPGQDLVRIGLVADIPDDLVLRRIEDAVQRYGKLDDAEAGAEMAPRDRNRVDELAAQFIGSLPKLAVFQVPQIARERNLVE